jgi:hypothetical protein
VLINLPNVKDLHTSFSLGEVKASSALPLVTPTWRDYCERYEGFHRNCRASLVADNRVDVWQPTAIELMDLHVVHLIKWMPGSCRGYALSFDITKKRLRPLFVFFSPHGTDHPDAVPQRGTNLARMHWKGPGCSLSDQASPAEILVSDNGSTDGSQEAGNESLGARVVHAQERGYGAALINGIQAASRQIRDHGRWG